MSRHRQATSNPGYTRPRLGTRAGLRTGIGGRTDELSAHFSVYVGNSDEGPTDPVTVEEILRTAPAFVETTIIDGNHVFTCTVPVLVSTYEQLMSDD